MKNLQETELCARGKRAAKSRYDKYPSAYANGHAVQVCKGKVVGLDGKKKTASGYKKSSGKPKSENDDSKERMNKLFEKLKSKLQEGILSEEYDFDVISEAKYNGRKVKLNKPFRQSSGGKKFAVYVRSKKGNVKKVRFGAKGYKVKNNDPKARKNFRKRHNCKSKKDKTKAGYWSCNIGRYAKSLGLSSSNRW